MILGYISIGLTILIVLVFAISRTQRPWVYYIGAFVVGGSLLLSTTLAGPLLIGTDINVEMYYARQALDGWDTTLHSTINSSMAVTILTPLLAGYQDSNLIWVFKIAYPLLFALVPILLIFIYSRFMPIKWAFLSAFVFILVPTFFLEMPQVSRQMVAMVLVTGMLAVLISNLDHKWKMLGLFIGSPLVIFAHYSTAVFWMALLAATVVGYLKGGHKWKTLDVGTIFVLSSILLIVYAYKVSSGWQLEDAGNVVQSLASGVVTVVQPAPAVASEVSVVAESSKVVFFSNVNPRDYLMTIPVLLILSYGFYRLLKLDTVPTLYKSWAVVVGLILAVGCLYPPIAAVVNFTRYLQLCLIVLAPCVVIPFGYTQLTVKFAAVLIMAFYFTSGLAFNFCHPNDISKLNLPYSIALENKRLDAGNYLTRDDGSVALWASQNGYSEVFGDMGGVAVLQNYFSVYQAKPIGVLVPGNIVLFRTWNTQHNTIAVSSGPGYRRQVPIPPDLKYRTIYQKGECKLVEIQ